MNQAVLKSDPPSGFFKIIITRFQNLMKLVFICHRHQRSSLFLVGTVQGKCQRDLQLFFCKSPDVRYNSTGRRRDISLADIEPVLITDHVNHMVFNTGAALLDAIVLAVVSREQEGTYGYKITQDVRRVLDVSESTMYPVLRRLQKDECLEVYDMQFDGRNRRYYKVTEKGMAQLNLYKVEWKNYTRKITEMFEGGAAE